MRSLVVAGLLLFQVARGEPASLKFSFGTGPAAAGFTPVASDTTYTEERGFGFEPGATVVFTTEGVSAEKPFYFTARVPAEGNYRVTLTLPGGTDATVKAELRRLMIERVLIPAGQPQKRSFIVNIRSPQIAATGEIKAGVVRLKAPRETTQEAWAWDHALTLEINGAHPAVSAVEIEPVSVPTVFLLGDSTVTDQSREPYNSWGQMLPRWFKPEIAIANHGESGETYRDSIGRRRLDKILSLMKAGDWLIMQFGANDQKQIAQGSGGPFTTYKAEIKRHVDAVQAHGGNTIIVSPMERRTSAPPLDDYAEASRQAAQELGVAYIDLNAASRRFYAALESRANGGSQVAFVPGDDTHHNNYGSYELAKFIVQSIKLQNLPFAKLIVDEFPGFDPGQPDDLAKFSIPASPHFTHQRPLGDEVATVAKPAPMTAATAYLFTYFTKNGEDGLHLAWSADGYKWEKLNKGKSFLEPKVGRSKLIRDPCITRGPNGIYHMVWTAGWTENDIGYATTKDFITWSEERELPVMAHEPTVRNTWAPEITYDEKREEFLIYWASTIPGRFPETAGASEDNYNHRIYSTTTKDFAAFAPTRLFYDPGFSVIDATLLRADDRSWLIVKDETRNPPKKFLRIAAVAGDLHGPFGELSAPFTPDGLWSEGPTAIKIGDEYLVYFEAYMKKYYCAMRSRDLKSWEDVTDKMTFVDAGTPTRMKHGTVIAVPADLVARLRSASR